MRYAKATKLHIDHHGKAPLLRSRSCCKSMTNWSKIWISIKLFILFANWWCPRDKSMKKTLQHLILCGGSKCRMWLFLYSVCAAIVPIFIVFIDFRCYPKYPCSDCRLISKLINFLTLTIWYGRSYKEPLLFQLHSQFLSLKKNSITNRFCTFSWQTWA